jgi:hypothetical protein
MDSWHVEESMSKADLEHSRKELKRISERMRASKSDNLMCQLDEDANQISLATCDLDKYAESIELTIFQLRAKAHGMENATVKTRVDAADLEASVASLNEAAAKLIKVAAKICARVAGMNVNMTLISAEVNNAHAKKAEEGRKCARETAQEEWRRRNMFDPWGGMGPWRTDMAKSVPDFWPEQHQGMNMGMNIASVDPSVWRPSLGNHRGSVDSYERRRSQNKGMHDASMDSYAWGSEIKEESTENDSWA